MVDALRRVAETKGASVAQIAIARVAAQGEDIMPLVGAPRRDRLAETLDVLDVCLSPDDLAAIETAVPKGVATGDRHPLSP